MNRDVLSVQDDKDTIAILKQAIENKDFETVRELGNL